MKNIITLLVITFLWKAAVSQKDSITYVVYPPQLGYLIHYDTTAGVYYVSRIFRVETFRDVKKPCQTVYHWYGSNKDSIGWYQYSSSDKPCIDSLTPCGCFGFGSMYPSTYKGDSIIDHNCEAWEYSLYKTEYFKPAKKRHWVKGEKYEMGPNERFADYKQWYPPSYIIMCM